MICFQESFKLTIFMITFFFKCSNSIAFRNIVSFSAGVIASIAVTSEIYFRIPQKVLFGDDPSPLDAFDNENIMIIFPGYGQ